MILSHLYLLLCETFSVTLIGKALGYHWLKMHLVVSSGFRALQLRGIINFIFAGITTEIIFVQRLAFSFCKHHKPGALVMNLRSVE